MMGRRRAIRTVKIAIALLLIAWILSAIDRGEFTRALSRAWTWKALIPIVLIWLSLGISAARWGVLLRALDRPVPVSFLFKSCLAGLFANNILPTAIGGDVVRVVMAARRTGDSAAASASVVADRLTGLAAVAACLTLGAALNTELMGRGANAWMLAAVGLVVLAGIVLFAAASRLRLRQSAASPSSLPGRLLQWLGKVLEAVQSYRVRPRAVKAALAWSFLFHITAVAVQWSALYALGLTVPFSLMLFVASLIFAAGLLPVTPNGYGLQDQLFILELSWAGYSPEDALAAFLLVRLSLLATSLFGAGVFFGTGIRKDPKGFENP